MVDVSVIIPAYNAQDTILDSLISIEKQSYKGNVEIIIINDGSNDDTQSVVNSYQKQSVIKVSLINQVNSGVASARNVGLKLAKGRYIAFLDSDDAWRDIKLEEQINFLERNQGFSMVGALCDTQLVKFEKLSIIEPNIYEVTFGQQLFKNYFQPSTVVIRREILENVGLFKEGRTHAEEGLFFYKIIRNHRCALIDCVLLFYGNGKRMFGFSGLSGDLTAMERGELLNYLEILNLGYIKIPKYIFLSLYSLIKYFRRLILSGFKSVI